uniref:D-serine dehydratase-like domain-containing protein n=1 Tax=Periophthalmus magnuspinnatus TaxID=409849 RepID=A0A3B4B7T9_9GOBI
SSLCTPALVVDIDKVKKNAERMSKHYKELGVQLRPHMKTHKTECADIMTGGSRRCIVVSTLAEACFYADYGFDDILFAYSVPFDKAIHTAEGAELTGVYAHCGNTYNCKGVEQIQAVAQETSTLTLQFMELKAVGITCKSSIGSTPSCSHPVKDMAQLSEVHPGNYVFYVQQSMIGSCSLEDVAVRVLTRVIGHCPHRNQLLIDCGWTGLLSMTQEHGRVEPISGKLDYSKYPLGTMLRLIPYHSCATAAMHPIYYVHCKDRLVGKWTPTRGW